MGRFKRPFKSVAEMDEVMVARWNETVAPDDTVWHLGDFAVRVGPAAMAALLDGLRGRKHLILGNNDPTGVATAAGWASVGHYAELVVDDVALVLCHYPFRSWNGQHKRSVNLHGHSHGRLKPLPRQHDVGVDTRDFQPVTLDQILKPPRP